MEKKITMGLCIGRHEIKEVSSYIFREDIKDPTNLVELERLAFRSIWDECMEVGALQPIPEMWEADWYGEDAYTILPGTKLDLYVTGLTVALIAALNVAKEQQIKVTLYHFDRESGGYYPQEVK